MNTQRKARVAIAGASGYTGAEILRLVAGHEDLTVTVLAGQQTVGMALGDIYPHLEPFAEMTIGALDIDEIAARAEVVLLALPHGSSMRLAPGLLEAGCRVVDLAGDFRLAAAQYPDWYGFEHSAPEWLEKAVYGLPELFAEEIPGAALVANPGCYPTPVALALAPLVRAELIDSAGLIIDGKSGISGAGHSPTEITHFAQRDGSVQPYKAGGAHQHTPEIERVLEAATGTATKVSFVPHLVPAIRGVLVTCYARRRGDAGVTDLLAAWESAYATAPFVRVLSEGTLPDTKRVMGSNTVELGAAVDERTETAILVGCLDNLVKGAAGQALQNLNLMLGFPETAGLEALAVYP
ncbi:MAG: N-acetyl-gamma-glutamyl-phosphate reductase [Actinomycetota bacterium]